MSQNSPAQELNDLLVTRDFDIKADDATTGKPPVDNEGNPDPSKADMFSFDWTASSGKNYGTVVILLGAKNNLQVFFGDNVGRGMDSTDKNEWYQFLQQLRHFAKRNRMQFDLEKLNKLKYTMHGIAAIKEGLFEGYYGNKKVSYSGNPTEARLMINHNRVIGEGDKRFRYVESLFIETTDNQRFRLPFKKLAGGQAMLEHVRQGGTPYDTRGQHISQIVEQLNVLSQFRRAHQGRMFEGAAGDLITETDAYYKRLRESLKHMCHSRGYAKYFETWSPADISDSELVVEDLKGLFVETRIDPRIEQALPMLARIQRETTGMKETEIFEAWVSRMTESTWQLPGTPEQFDQLNTWLSQPRPVGPDANVTEELYTLLGDDDLWDQLEALAAEDVDADAVPLVKAWIARNADDYSEVAEVQSKLEAAALAAPPAEPEVEPTIPSVEPAVEPEVEPEVEPVVESSCNNTTEGVMCPRHGITECGMHEGTDSSYESSLARIKSLALSKRHK